MARYMLSVFGPTERSEFGDYPSKEAMLEAFADTGAFNEKLERDGHFVFADGLEPATTATTVDGQGEKPGGAGPQSVGPVVDRRGSRPGP